MTKDSNASLEREIEEIRERLAGTIDELLYRSNPKTITSRQVATVKAKFVDPVTGEPKTDVIVKTAGIVVGVLVGFTLLRKIARR
ncbi:DUF3618 domain-containing protein [Nocardioides sp.]|uniref:DUF3618 domain-containing protein n=1 Tax=Nocardioides sp. TaxID=35761 RepID=UPI00262C344B|nr:DUF3618 domain-containing protein [Nocardioides sp.]